MNASLRAAARSEVFRGRPRQTIPEVNRTRRFCFRPKPLRSGVGVAWSAVPRENSPRLCPPLRRSRGSRLRAFHSQGRGSRRRTAEADRRPDDVMRDRGAFRLARGLVTCRASRATRARTRGVGAFGGASGTPEPLCEGRSQTKRGIRRADQCSQGTRLKRTAARARFRRRQNRTMGCEQD